MRQLQLLFLLLILSAPVLANQVLDRCPAPRITFISQVVSDAATINWTASDSVLAVDLEWRENGTMDWNTITGIVEPYELKGLEPCRNYDVRVLGHCNGSDSNASAYWTFETDACCRIPTGVRLVTAGETTATLAWDSVSFAFAHPVRYRAVGTEAWTSIEVATHLAGLQDLEGCTAYEFQVGSKCDLDSTDFTASFLFQTTSCGSCSVLTYCGASGDDGSAEWIDSISFAGLRMKSGSNLGYLLQNTVSTSIERKRPYHFHVTPGSTIPDATFYLRMWIDLNMDGVFTDSSELLVDPVDPIGIEGWDQQITIDDSVSLGNTRMRIVLKSIVGQDTLRPDACGSFLFGEVEDYCISIGDLCPEVRPEVILPGANSVTIEWPAVPEAIVFIYRYGRADDMMFGDNTLTEDTTVMIGDLAECTEYLLQTLSVCVQDTSSWQEFLFKTECPNAIESLAPVARDVVVYPVPFDDQLTLRFTPLASGTGRMILLDIVGREMHSAGLSFAAEEEQIVQLSHLDRLPHGIYLLSIEIGNRRQVIKISR